MQRADVFEVKAFEREPQPGILLARPGDDAALAIDAVALLAQYQLRTGDVLLVLDEDTPFEEQLHLVLVRSTGILDHLVIGAPYASGISREVAVDEDSLCFRFESEAVWTASANGEGSRGVGGLPSGVHRRGGWLARRYLALTWAPAE